MADEGSLAEAEKMLLETLGEPGEAPKDEAPETVDAQDAEGEPVEAEAADAADDDQDDQSDAGDEDDGEADDDEEPTYRVKVHGEWQDVPLSKLQKAYSLNEARERTLQEAAEARNRAQQEAQQYVQQAQMAAQQSAQYVQALQQRIQYFESMTERVDPPSSQDFETDPIGSMQQQARYNEYVARMQQVQHARSEIERQQAAQRAYAEQQLMAAEVRRFQEMVPDFDRERDYGRIVAYVKKHGYTEGQLKSVKDAGTLKALYDAAKFDELQASKPSKDGASSEKEPPKTLRPGTRKSVTSTKKRKQKESMSRLAKTGSVDAAAEVLLDRL